MSAGGGRLAKPERQLLLASAGTAGRRAELAERVLALSSQVDWARLAEALRVRRLMPTLGPRILDLAQGQADHAFEVAVDQALEAVRRQGAFLQLVSVRILAMLADAGIRATPLKGPLLSERIYGDPGRRVSTDVDLLVATEQLRAAVAIVRQLGYLAPADHVDRDGLPQLHFVLLHPRQQLPPVELHWRVHPYERMFAGERLLPPTETFGEWRPDPAAELVSLLLFYARDGFIDLRLASDLSAWWDARGEELERGAVDEISRAYPALARVLRAAVATAERVVGLPSSAIFEEVRALGLRGRVASRLANPNPSTNEAQLYADMGLVDGLLAPRGGLVASLRRRVLLPREALDELDRRAPKRRARSSGSRAAGMLGRYALSLTRASLVRDETPR